jgi:valyl-tRNA synthetase
MWEGKQAESKTHYDENNFAVDWFENRLSQVKADLKHMYDYFRLSEALKTIYSLIWDDFCSWYLEWVKPGFEQPIEKNVYDKTIYFFEELMLMLHPFMPFVTEEIYHQLKERKESDDLTIKQNSEFRIQDSEILKKAELLKQVITALRDVRVKNQLKPKEEIKLNIQTAEQSFYNSFRSILAKQVNASAIDFVKDSVNGTINTVVQKDKFFIETEKELDTTAQKEQLIKDLEYQKGFLSSVEKKLGNERFVQNAKPEVVEVEKKKKADAEAKIKAIKESLQSLST